MVFRINCESVFNIGVVENAFVGISFLRWNVDVDLEDSDSIESAAGERGHKRLLTKHNFCQACLQRSWKEKITKEGY